MKNDFFTNLSASLISNLLSQVDLTPKSTIAIIEHLLSQVEFVSKSPSAVMSALQSQAELVSNAINALPESTSYQGSFDFLKRINIQEDFIELTENDCDSINALLESSNSTDVLPKISKGKIKLVDFIKTILIPILAIILPMLLTFYYHKVDSIESQKRHIAELQIKQEELQLRETELQLWEEELRIKEQQLQNDIEKKEILENILIEIQNQSEYYKSLLMEPECPLSVPEPFDEVPEHFDEAPHSPDDTQDNDLSNLDESKSSGTAMHKE